MEYRYLENIKGPEDVKKIPEDKLPELAAEIREALFNRLSKIGGHFGPNFGSVELTIALHYIFESPKDQLVFDVSHQTYTHKMLTGRSKGYTDDAHFSDIGGFTDPAESEHDMFFIGHTSTSVSLATGLAKGRDLTGKKGNVIAVIGDGSLSGGEALEGLDQAGEMDTNLIIVVNDNEQSIAENHGGLYKGLALLRESSGTCDTNLFKAMGLDYKYVEEGNDISVLIKAFSEVKDIEHPIVVHVHTTKGMGYEPAMKNREDWHYTAPFDRATGKSLVDWSGESYNSIFANHIIEKIKEDDSIVVVTAAVPGAVGLGQDVREKLGDNYVDVGIAEEQATAMCSGMAKNGGKPIFATCATFAQRIYDQITLDVSLNKSAVTLHLSSPSIFGMSDATHIGIQAIPMFSNIPGLVYLCPTNKDEYLAMLDYSIAQNERPFVIAVPGGPVVGAEYPVDTDYSDIDKYQVCESGKEIAILALGDFFSIGKKAAAFIEEKTGQKVTLINPRFASGVDKELLDKLTTDHKIFITLEDGMLDGGFGQKVASYLGNRDVKVLNYGFEKIFYDGYNIEELLKERHLTPEGIWGDIEGILKN